MTALRTGCNICQRSLRLLIDPVAPPAHRLSYAGSSSRYQSQGRLYATIPDSDHNDTSVAATGSPTSASPSAPTSGSPPGQASIRVKPFPSPPTQDNKHLLSEASLPRSDTVKHNEINGTRALALSRLASIRLAAFDKLQKQQEQLGKRFSQAGQRINAVTGYGEIDRLKAEVTRQG